MIVLGIIFVVLLLLAVPIAFTVGISAVSFFMTNGIPMEIVVQKMVSSTQSFFFRTGWKFDERDRNYIQTD